MPSLSSGTQDLLSLSWRAGFFSFVVWELLIVPRPGNLGPLHWVQSLSHWTTREVPDYYIFLTLVPKGQEQCWAEFSVSLLLDRIQSLATRRLMSKSRRMTWTEKQPALSHSPAAGAESLLCLQFMHLNPAFWHDIQGPSLLLLPLSDLFCLDSHYFSELIFTAGQEEFILEFIPVFPRNVFQPPDALALLWSLPRMPPTCPSPTPSLALLSPYLSWHSSVSGFKSSCFPARWFVPPSEPTLVRSIL